MHSIISDSDMLRKYYYARSYIIEFVQMQLNRNIDQFQLGAENLQPRRTFESMMVEVKTMKYRQEIQHFREQKMKISIRKDRKYSL